MYAPFGFWSGVLNFFTTRHLVFKDHLQVFDAFREIFMLLISSSGGLFILFEKKIVSRVPPLECNGVQWSGLVPGLRHAKCEMEK